MATTSDKKYTFDATTGQLLITGSSSPIEDLLNVISEGSMAYSAVTSGYTTLLSLGTTRYFEKLMISNSLNQEIKLRIGGVSEITIPASENRVYDGFIHNGDIEIKYSSIAPSGGDIFINCW